VLTGTAGLHVLASGGLPRDDVLRLIKDADGLLIRSSTTVDREMFEAAPRLKVIGRAGVGVDNVDLTEATAHGVAVTNTPDGNTIATAEYAFGLMLALLRHIPDAHSSLGSGKWDRKTYGGTELRGKTLGIVGLGRIGRALARRAAAFDMKIIAFDAFEAAREIANSEGLVFEWASLEQLFARADVISLHPSLTDDTRKMINAASLQRMKPGVFLINAARGALIDDSDLADALASGHVAGAAIDVYDEEPPPPDHPLLRAPHVIHTPHLAASTEEAQINVAIDAAQQVADALIKGDYRNVVNQQVLRKV